MNGILRILIVIKFSVVATICISFNKNSDMYSVSNLGLVSEQVLNDMISEIVSPGVDTLYLKDTFIEGMCCDDEGVVFSLESDSVIAKVKKKYNSTKDSLTDLNVELTNNKFLLEKFQLVSKSKIIDSLSENEMFFQISHPYFFQNTVSIELEYYNHRGGARYIYVLRKDQGGYVIVHKEVRWVI